MIILDLQQGSKEWHEARAAHLTASEAPAMMGASKYQSRNDLLKQKATGITPEVSEHQQRIFDKGHEAEAKARSIAERIIGEELFPATASKEGTNLLASYDGITMMEDVCWEHKLWNQKLAAAVEAGELEPHYYWQMEQQLLVSGAERCLFMCSDGTEDNMAWMWYYPVEGRKEELIAGWTQFESDLKNFKLTEVKPEAVATTQAELPALLIDITGEVKSSNLSEFKEAAIARIDSVNTDLVTDQDFADADATVKFFDKGEKQLEQVKKQALAQTASIDELFSTIDELKASMRNKRLELNKLVNARKEQIRAEIILNAKEALNDHIEALNADLGKYGFAMPAVVADFAGAIKGKKNIVSLQGAADDELAQAKASATQQAEAITSNAILLNEMAVGYEHLFADRAELVALSKDHLRDKATSRISAFKEEERVKQEQERERIRQEEEAKAQAKAEAQANGEAQKRGEEAHQQAKEQTPRFTPPTQRSDKPSFAALEANVIDWAAAREIFSKATPLSQMEKTDEEVQELRDAIEAMNLAEIEDAIGDIIVTLIIQGHMHGLSAEKCLASAYDQIKDRSGQMVDGIFVKDDKAA